jgi:hypothetical protein
MVHVSPFSTHRVFSGEQAKSACDFDGNVVSVCRQTIKTINLLA